MRRTAQRDLLFELQSGLGMELITTDNLPGQCVRQLAGILSRLHRNCIDSPVRGRYVAIARHIHLDEEEGSGEDGDEEDDDEGRKDGTQEIKEGSRFHGGSVRSQTGIQE